MAPKKSSGKKNWKRKAWGKKQRTTNVNKSISPFASRYITKMKYAEQLDVTGPGLAGFATHRFNLNSIYDPNRSGTGHQPHGRDELNAIYNRYRVIGCSYVISAINTSSSGDAYSIIAALPANQEVNLSGGIFTAQETPRCKFITQAPNAPLKVLRGYVNLPALMGRAKPQYMADDDYQAQFDASPNELAILNVYAGAIDNGAETNNMKVNIVLEYTVECFDPKILPVS